MLAELTAANRSHPPTGGNCRKLKWTGSIIEWVELIYALYAAGVINGGKIFLKDLFRSMGELFDFEVREFSNYFMNIKNRVKGDRTTFLDKLKDRLLHRMEEADRKPPRE